MFSRWASTIQKRQLYTVSADQNRLVLMGTDTASGDIVHFGIVQC